MERDSMSIILQQLDLGSLEIEREVTCLFLQRDWNSGTLEGTAPPLPLIPLPRVSIIEARQERKCCTSQPPDVTVFILLARIVLASGMARAVTCPPAPESVLVTSRRCSALASHASLATRTLSELRCISWGLGCVVCDRTVQGFLELVRSLVYRSWWVFFCRSGI